MRAGNGDWSMSEAIEARAAVCDRVIRQAGALALGRFRDRGGLSVSFKGPQDYLSDVDAAVERLIAEALAESFPQDGLLGEEGGGEIKNHMWVVDPIDGTANFVRAIPHFCVSVAFVANGTIELGAILNPATDEMFLARRGHGATLNGRPMAVASTADMTRASVELGWSTRSPNEVYLAMVDRVLGSGASFRRSGSGALGLAYVADGRTDGYAELHINSWDCLAGILLVTEAGGRVSDFLAGDGLAKGNALLAAAPGVADVMAELTGIDLGR
jgi:myo-inositol-1(or 4)-monophosphatase